MGGLALGEEFMEVLALAYVHFPVQSVFLQCPAHPISAVLTSDVLNSVTPL